MDLIILPDILLPHRYLSHPLQHVQNKKHPHVWVNDFTILNSDYRSKIKRKISEQIYIRSKRPMLNTKETSMKLNPFN